MNQNLISKRTKKGIIHIPGIDKMINTKPPMKYKSNDIINIYSTLTPTESSNLKNKNLIISSNIRNINKNINKNQNNNINTNKNQNQNNISNDILKIKAQNLKYKGSLSSTNIKTNYNIFKTKKLKSTTALINNKNSNNYGGSIKMSNLLKQSINKNKNKSKERIIYSFYDDKNNFLFRKSMSHNKMKIQNSNKENKDNFKYGLLYIGSEPNLKQKSSNKFQDYKNEVKKEIKNAFKRLLTLNTDFEFGSLYKIKFKYNHMRNSTNNKSLDNIKINENNNNNKIKYNNEKKKKKALKMIFKI